ncbi:polysaccharide biosynthesis tyrosine autokinase [bacterium]|nr:polysaccharide biosynthesis tyrosine autokinase [bacterium]
MNSPLQPSAPRNGADAGSLDGFRADPGVDYGYDGTTVDSGAQSLRVRRFLVFLRRYWWIPGLTLLLGLAGEAAYVKYKAPKFVSMSSMVETVKIRLPEGSLFSDDMDNFLGTLSEILQSGTLRDLTLQRLRDMTNAVPIPLGESGQALPVAINVAGSSKGSVFKITAASPGPLYTQQYLNALMAAYLDYKRNIRQLASGNTLASITEQVQRRERDLKADQDALTGFESTNNLAVLEEEVAVAGSYLTKLKTRLSDLQLEARLLDAAQNEEQQNTNRTAAVPVPWTELADGVTASTSLAGASQQSNFKDLELLKIERARLSRNLRPKHPKIVHLDAEITRAEKVQEIYRRQSRDELIAARQANRLKAENVTSSIREWEVKVANANKLIAQANRLKTDIERTKSVYERLQNLVQNVDISRNIDRENLEVLEFASAPVRSYAEEKSGLLLAVAGGLLSGLGLVFLISIRDDRFTSVTEVNSTFGDVVVGLLPEVTHTKKSGLPLLHLDNSQHASAEAYRSLRSALHFINNGSVRPKILLVTSAMPDEGKSTIAVNLARTLAMSGSKVLLVDGDLRKGHIHDLLNLSGKPGLTEILNRRCDARDATQVNSIANLHFISRGASSRNPGDLFLDSPLDQVLAHWRQEFDYVVIDSSPLFAADDVSCVAPKVDGTLFVVRRNRSSARVVYDALDLLARRHAKVLGVVFNGADSHSRSYSYYQQPEYFSHATSA